MKKVLIAVLTVIVCAAVLTACGEDKTEYTGQDEYGRYFGEIYDVDSQESGVFELPYEIGGTSAMGESMIGANCADYVRISKEGNDYEFTFLCKNGMLGSVEMAQEEGYIKGKESDEGDLQGYTFAISRDGIGQSVGLRCVVRLMNKTVEFTVKADLQKARLVG